MILGHLKNRNFQVSGHRVVRNGSEIVHILRKL